MRVLVCGGRTYDEFDFVADILDQIHEEMGITCVIHGGAKGADDLGDLWATLRCVPVDRFPANWDKFGNAAGPKRNQQMLDAGKPDMVVAFRGNRGTQDMVKRAKAAKLLLLDFNDF